MSESEMPSLNCASNEVIDILTHKWVTQLVLILSERKYRYNELLKLLEGISKKVLTHSLRELEKYGLVKRTAYPIVPPVVEYELTPLGEALLPILHALKDWAEVNKESIEVAREIYQEKKAQEIELITQFN